LRLIGGGEAAAPDAGLVIAADARQAAVELRALCREPPPRRLGERLSLLDRIIAAQSAHRSLQGGDAFGRAVLRAIWAAEEIAWAAVEALLGWAEAAGKIDLPADLLALASSIDAASCAALADELQADLDEFRVAFARKSFAPISVGCSGSQPRAEIPLAEIDRVSLSPISGKLDDWAWALDVFNDWIGARDALAMLRQRGIASIAEELGAGTMRPCEARPTADLLIAEALWRAACSDDPILEQIDGGLCTETVLRFRDLDQERISLARLEVLARYYRRKPDGQAGEMGIVRAEIGKKRRHLPIRKLMKAAGPATQRLTNPNANHVTR
jgi:hypothetical protein